MKREDHKAKLTALLGLATPENQARASELLTELSDDYEEVLTASENNANQVATLTANNETLRDVNAKLFLKVGATDKTTVHTDKGDNGNENKGDGSDSITFDKLFNEKGELM